MATTVWIGNQANLAEVDSLTVGGTPLAGATVVATMNTKSVTYLQVTGDTTATVASGLLALLQASTAPPEFGRLTYAISATNSSQILVTGEVDGRPFTMTASATGGGATLTRASVTTPTSQSDVNDNNNWLRGGTPGIPQNNDDVIVADSSVPLLYNLDKLAAVQFNSYRRWQSMTGAIGLPENNPSGYHEYLPTYFQFTVPAGGAKITLGETIGGGGGPPRERYNLGSTGPCTINVLASGSPADDFAVRILGTNASNTLNVTNTSVGVAMLPTETATIASATVDGGGSLSLGSGVTFSGTLTVTSGTVVTACAPATITATQNSSITVIASALTYTTITASQSTTVTWLSDSTITTLTLKTGSFFDKSQDVRGMTITNSSMEVDTCILNDPTNAITFTNATTTAGAVNNGPFLFGPGRTVKWV